MHEVSFIFKRPYKEMSGNKKMSVKQACQWMSCNRTHMHLHTLFMYTCYCCACKTLYHELIACKHLTSVLSYPHANNYFFYLFLSSIKKFVLQFSSCADHQCLDNVFFCKRFKELYFSSVYLFLFTVVWEITMKTNCIKIFFDWKINQLFTHFSPADQGFQLRVATSNFCLPLNHKWFEGRWA